MYSHFSRALQPHFDCKMNFAWAHGCTVCNSPTQRGTVEFGTKRHTTITQLRIIMLCWHEGSWCILIFPDRWRFILYLHFSQALQPNSECKMNYAWGHGCTVSNSLTQRGTVAFGTKRHTTITQLHIEMLCWHDDSWRILIFLEHSRQFLIANWTARSSWVYRTQKCNSKRHDWIWDDTAHHNYTATFRNVVFIWSFIMYSHCSQALQPWRPVHPLIIYKIGCTYIMRDRID
jgi:hypothetical protein